MNCECIIECPEKRPAMFDGAVCTRKIVKNANSSMGHMVRGRYSGRWLATTSPERHRKLDWIRATDCNECKHQLACLIDPECDRWFEARVVGVLPNE